MATWDETTPSIERTLQARPLSATNAILGLNILTLLAGILLSRVGIPLEAILGFLPMKALGEGWLWQFVTWPLAHSLDVGPLVFSLLAGWLLFRAGNELEQEWGPRRLLLYFFGTGAIGACVHAISYGMGGTQHPSTEFLGPALAIVLAHALRARDRVPLFLAFLPMRPSIAFSIAFLVGLTYAIGFRDLGTSPFAVAGSVACGAAILGAGPAWIRHRQRWNARAARTRFVEEIDLRRQVDLLLEKIQREGLRSLSWRERRVLHRGSRLYRPRDDR